MRIVASRLLVEAVGINTFAESPDCSDSTGEVRRCSSKSCKSFEWTAARGRPCGDRHPAVRCDGIPLGGAWSIRKKHKRGAPSAGDFVLTCYLSKWLGPDTDVALAASRRADLTRDRTTLPWSGKQPGQ
jgi:hypothetical protein